MATAPDGSTVRYWRNQYGAGLVIEGPLAELIETQCELLGITANEWLRRAIAQSVLDRAGELKS